MSSILIEVQMQLIRSKMDHQRGFKAETHLFANRKKLLLARLTKRIYVLLLDCYNELERDGEQVCGLHKHQE